MPYLFAVLAVLSLALYFLGPWVVGLILIPAFLLAKGFMRWMGVVVFALALSAPVASRAESVDDCMEYGDCELADHSGPSFGCIGSDSEDCRWNAVDYGLQGGFLALTLADWATTHRAINQNRPGWNEANPILGRYPSTGKLAAYNLGVMAGHTAISMILPKPWRTLWQGVWIGVGIDTMVIWGGSVYFPW